MTTIINLAEGRAGANLFSVFSTGMAIFLVGLVLVVLVEKVLLGAFGQKNTGGGTRAFDVILWPMMVMLALVVILRVAQILL